MAAIVGPASLDWLRYNGTHVTDDATHVRYALALRATTAPDARIAVVWAGALSYFSHRDTVDLLGKSDRVIATGVPHPNFVPGHDKWNYGYSIGRLRPDVVAELWHPTANDLEEMGSWGYQRLPSTSGYAFVRSGDVSVDIRGLNSFISSGVEPRATPFKQTQRAGST
jgi:hypothetical protein